MADRLRSVPAWAWLAAIVTLSFAFRAWLARGMLGPFIMVDELIYSELAKSLASGFSLQVRDLPVGGYGWVYPLLIAPAYRAFANVTEAYAALKTINSLVMSLAAVPTYLIARRVIRPGLALLAALMAVVVPSMVYTAVVMTENAFYPLFLCAALALVLLLEQPSARRTAAFLVLLLLAYETRSQAVAIAAAALTAPLLLAALSGTGLRATLRAYRLLYGAFAAAALLVAAAQLARGKSFATLLGSYAEVGQAHYDAAKAMRYVVYHAAELDLYLGVVPVAATIVLVARGRSLDHRLQCLLAATLALFLWFAVVVGTFASRFADRIQERNMFALTPLFVILLLAWLERGAPRPRIVAAAAAAAATLLLFAIPFDDFVTTSAVSDTLMLLPWWALQIERGTTHLALFAVLGAGVFALAFLVVPARYALALPLAVMAYWLVVFQPIWFGPYPYGVRQAGAGAVFQGIRGVPRDWIDAAVPAGAEVDVLYTGKADRFTVNQNEFFNRSVGRVFYTTVPTPGGVGETQVVAGARDGVVRTPDGAPVLARYVLADGSVEPEGSAVARDLPLGMTVWKLSGPLTLARTRTTGIDADAWSGPVVTWTRERCRGGTLTVSLSGDARLFPEGQVVTASTGESVRVPPNELARLTVPVTPRDSVCRAVFRVRPTAKPSLVLPGSTDDRLLGTHFTAFAYEPSS